MHDSPPTHTRNPLPMMIKDLLFRVACLISVSQVTGKSLLPSLYSRAVDERAVQIQARQLSNVTGTTSDSTDGYRYLNNATQPYLVTSMPDVDIPLGELYSGSLSIQTPNSTVNGSGTLFYFFKPTTGDPVDELTIWINGGPGWSSMEGFFQEIGPVVWQKGAYGPVANAYAWSNLTNMIWVDQPISTGFAVGTPTATNEQEVAEQFLGFLQNFQDLFGIKNYKVYLTGESYAGMYLPYLGAGMLEKNNTEYFNLSGMLLFDPTIGEQAGQALFPFVEAHANILNFNDSFYSQLESTHKACGFDTYLTKYLAFPPPGNQPSATLNETCAGLAGLAGVAEIDVNPCFDIYDVRDICPTRYDPLGHSTDYTYNPVGVPPYFNRSDVKAAIHAPMNVTWILDNGGGSTFVGGEDLSEPPIFTVLPKVIEATNRVLIANGDFDMLIPTQQTLVAIQNMTWNGQLGFRAAPNATFSVPYVDLQYNPQWVAGGFLGDKFSEAGDPQGVMGVQHFERGLMWVETFQAGHSVPYSQPRVTYRQLQWVLGRIDEF